MNHGGMNELIKLDLVSYNHKARNGVWCTLPYPGHLKGCPQFPECPRKYKDFMSLSGEYLWYAVIEEFDLKTYAEERKLLHPEWSDRQCRNLLYWQGGVRSRLKKKAYAEIGSSQGIVLEVPEACGVNVFDTMKKVDIMPEKYPQIVRKIMLVGKS